MRVGCDKSGIFTVGLTVLGYKSPVFGRGFFIDFVVDGMYFGAG